MRLLLSAAAVVLLAACGAAPPAGEGPTPSTGPTNMTPTATGTNVHIAVDAPLQAVVLRGPVEAAWLMLPPVYEQLGLPIDYSNVETLTLGVQEFTGQKIGDKRTTDYIRCGNQGSGGSAFTRYRTKVRILTTLQSNEDGNTLIQTHITATGTSMNGASTQATHCNSTGELEGLIASMVRQRLPRR